VRLYRITGRAGNTHWLSAELGMDVRDELTRRYNALSRRRGLPPILHGPGAVCGDATDTQTGAVHAVRDGHGVVSLENAAVAAESGSFAPADGCSTDD